VTDRDRWWLTATVWMEARGEPRQGKLAVAYNILHRVRSGRWGQQVGEVVLAPFQYSCWNTDSPTRRALARCDELAPSWIDSTVAVEYAVTGAKPDPIDGALHYYNPDVVKPHWDRSWYPRVTIGHHVFVCGVP
jgi:N-acetylmuramoyl-L-alanine amidase